MSYSMKAAGFWVKPVFKVTGMGLESDATSLENSIHRIVVRRVKTMNEEQRGTAITLFHPSSATFVQLAGKIGLCESRLICPDKL